jgi:hypothetical protein
MADQKIELQDQQPHAGGFDYGIAVLVFAFLAAAALVFLVR